MTYAAAPRKQEQWSSMPGYVSSNDLRALAAAAATEELDG